MADHSTEEVEQKIIAEEYKVWKKNAPFLYDVVLTHPLEWPSLTVQWLPNRKVASSGDYAEHKIILGTHTSGSEQNYLCIANVKLPTEDAQIDARKYDEEKGELGGHGGSGAKVEIAVRMNHDQEVNRARYCPHNEFLIATKSPSADVYVYDYSKHPSKPVDGANKPQLRLKGHEKEGYGLSWSSVEKGRLISAGDDKLVCMWDIEAADSQSSGGSSGSSSSSASTDDKGTRTIQAARKFAGHTAVVEDVAWHRHSPHIFASCGDDRLVALWDVRDASNTAPRLRIPASAASAHKDDVMSLSFNPYQEFLFLTGSVDRTVKLWDSRNLAKALHTFAAHSDEVLNVVWAPFNESVFASSSADRRVFVWDCSRIGQEQSEEDAEDGPPELLFVHGGHTSKVSDFGWCESDDWYVASVAEDNILQVWQMAENIYASGDDEEEDAAGDATASGKQGADDGDIE